MDAVAEPETIGQRPGGLRLLILAPNPRISGPFPGPIARIAYSLVEALRAAGCTVETELWGRHEARESNAARVTGRARDLGRIRRRIRSGRLDVVFINTTHDWRAMTRDLLLLFSLPPRVKWVLLFHGSHPDWLTHPGHALVKLETRLLLRRSRAVLLLSSEEAQQWKRFSPRTSFQVVSNPYHYSAGSRQRRACGTSVGVLYVGRLVREKGVLELLEAFALVRQQLDCALLIAGEGPSESELRGLAKELGVQQHVSFLGFLNQDELEGVYEEAHMLVLPSYREGFPTVVLEAMSHGLPLITTPIRGALDHLREGENVLFVPLRSPDRLAAAIATLARDEGLRKQIGENNRRKVQDFAPHKVVRDYLNVFSRVAEDT